MKDEEGDFNQKMLWASFFNNHKKKIIQLINERKNLFEIPLIISVKNIIYDHSGENIWSY